MQSGTIRKSPSEWRSNWPTKQTPDKTSPVEEREKIDFKLPERKNNYYPQIT